MVSAGQGWAEPVVPRSKAYVGAWLPRVERAASRPCGPIDLIGTWQLVGYGSPRQLNRTDAPYAFPYQVFRFAEDGTLQSAHSRTAFRETPEQVFTRLPTVLSYEMHPMQTGVVVVKRPDVDEAAETWFCRTLTIDQIDLTHRTLLRRGDVVLTLVGKSGAPLFTRHLRKH